MPVHSLCDGEAPLPPVGSGKDDICLVDWVMETSCDWLSAPGVPATIRHTCPVEQVWRGENIVIYESFRIQISMVREQNFIPF